MRFKRISRTDSMIELLSWSLKILSILFRVQSTVQSMFDVLGRRHRLLHVRSLLTRWFDREQEVHQVSSWPLFDSSHEQTMLSEVNMDFRILGMSHSVVKHQSTSVRELIQKIENHPDRHALQQDLRQNQVYNPFSPESKIMIQGVDNIELFELLETDPKTQCTACLSYWNVEIVYCTYGHFLQKETETNRNFGKISMDLFSAPEYVIKKRRPHGHRYGKKSGDK